MATRHWFGRTHSSHHMAGYCCVFLAAAYVAAIVFLVGYLIATLLW